MHGTDHVFRFLFLMLVHISCLCGDKLEGNTLALMEVTVGVDSFLFYGLQCDLSFSLL